MGEGLFGKFKTLIGVEDIEDEEEEVTVAEAPVRAQAAPAATRPAAITAAQQPKMAQSSKYDRNNTFVQPKMDHRENKVVSMNNTNSGKKQFKLVVIEPVSFDECPKLVDNLKNKKPVILNLEKLENEKARKIFDFLSGAIYALDGNVQKIANNIFVFAPENVDVLSTLDSSTRESLSVAGSPWRR